MMYESMIVSYPPRKIHKNNVIWGTLEYIYVTNPSPPVCYCISTENQMYKGPLPQRATKHGDT